MDSNVTTRIQGSAPWLLLIFSLPTRQASHRVEIWRKLQRYGALRLRSAGHILPRSSENQEHFEWLAAAIRKYGGDASVAEVRSIDNLPSEQLVRLFQEARTRQYESLSREIKKLAANPKRTAAQLGRLRRRFQEIVSIDFFESPLRSRAEGLLTNADRVIADPKDKPVQSRQLKKFIGRVWITRPRPGIDRVSSAWLISRFIDPKARFEFAKDTQQRPHAVPFDMFGDQGFGHRGNSCTFETLCRHFSIRDTRASAIAQIVHDADLLDEKFGRPEGAGLDKVLIGWAQQGLSDEEILRRGMEMIEGLYQGLT